jgi:hypoxanthine phosphoribosyltransferase
MSKYHEILFDEQTIANKVRELASRISKDYEGKEAVLVCILKGALTFTADLMRLLTIPVTIECIQAASYGASTISSGNITSKQDIETDIRDRHVLLVDTIIDTGKTMDCLLRKFRARGPASLGTVALLDKKTRRSADVPVTYSGFEIPDTFVVGYGMDSAERYRNLPYIASLKPAVREITGP